MLLVPEDIRSGKHQGVMDIARREGKWEGTMLHVRKNGQQFTARVVITARRDLAGKAIGYLLISKDISAEIRLAEELKATQYYARSLIEASLDPLVTISPQGAITDLNEAWVQATGVHRELLIGTDFLDYFTEPDKAREGYQRVFSQGYVRDYPLAIRHTSGRVIDVLYNASVYKDDEGKVLGVCAAARDVTERKQAEVALLKAGALQRAIFNSANFSSIATDAKGVIQIFNVGAERMLGYTAAEVMNKITPADISDPQEVIARAKALSVELGTPITPGFEALVFKASRGIEDIYELTYFRKDGSRFPAVVSVTALRDAQDTIIGYLLIGTDNTARQQVEEERKKLDQRLRDQQFYTRSLIESNIDALMTTDPLGIITDVNKQMEALTGCTRDELIGAPFKNNFTDPERAEAGIKLVLSQKKVNDYELTACARDGGKTDVSYNATTFYDRDRKLQGVFASARDVTERKRFEQSIQEANRMKSEFLANMSHELRTPLNCVIGFAEFLVDGKPGAMNPKQKEYLEDILNSGRHLLQLINDVLDLAKVEAGRMELNVEAFSLRSAIEEVCAVAKPMAQKKHIAVSLELEPGLDHVTLDSRSSSRCSTTCSPTPSNLPTMAEPWIYADRD
jgi:PAS domain S-box-containing protein